MNNLTKKMILRYAEVVALGEQATEEQIEELHMIEDQLHLTKDSILRMATEIGLASIK